MLEYKIHYIWTQQCGVNDILEINGRLLLFISKELVCSKDKNLKIIEEIHNISTIYKYKYTFGFSVMIDIVPNFVSMQQEVMYA